MRPNSGPGPTDGPAPRPTYSLRRTLTGTLLLLVAFAAGLLAASYPGTAALVAVVGVAGWRAARTVRGRLRRRRETIRTRQVCLPVGPCLEA